MEDKEKRKPKRVLKNIDFENGTNTHLALVHRDQGGPASGADYKLVIKASNFSDEFLEKMSTIKVELDIPDFLERFFKLEEDDSKFLAYLLGYTEDPAEEAMEPEMDYQKWIKENTKSFEVIKALNKTPNHAEVLAKLNEDQYLDFLQDQQRFEKGLKKLEAKKQEEFEKAEAERKKPRVKKQVAKAATEVAKEATQESPEVVKTTKADVNTSITQREVEEGKGNSPVVKTTNKEKRMSKTQSAKSVEVEVTTTQEMVEKAAFESIQKQFVETQEMLQKALATVAQFEQEKKELIAKQRLANLEAVVAKEHADVIFKAVKDTADEDFQAVVKALGTISVAVAQSDLFVEKGVVVEDKPVENESAVARLIKAKLQAKQ